MNLKNGFRALFDGNLLYTIALISAVIIALVVRISGWGYVFIGDKVLFMGADPYYHMRAIAYTSIHFPKSFFIHHAMAPKRQPSTGGEPRFQFVQER